MEPGAPEELVVELTAAGLAAASFASAAKSTSASVSLHLAQPPRLFLLLLRALGALARAPPPRRARRARQLRRPCARARASPPPSAPRLTFAVASVLGETWVPPTPRANTADSGRRFRLVRKSLIVRTAVASAPSRRSLVVQRPFLWSLAASRAPALTRIRLSLCLALAVPVRARRASAQARACTGVRLVDGVQRASSSWRRATQILSTRRGTRRSSRRTPRRRRRPRVGVGQPGDASGAFACAVSMVMARRTGDGRRGGSSNRSALPRATPRSRTRADSPPSRRRPRSPAVPIRQARPRGSSRASRRPPGARGGVRRRGPPRGPLFVQSPQRSRGCVISPMCLKRSPHGPPRDLQRDARADCRENVGVPRAAAIHAAPGASPRCGRGASRSRARGAAFCARARCATSWRRPSAMAPALAPIRPRRWRV